MEREELHPLACVGADGETREFYCLVTQEPFVGSDQLRLAWQYMVYDEVPVANDDEPFEAEFVEIDATRVLSKMMTRRGLEQYRAKGTPEAVIADVARRTQRRVVSSSTDHFLIDNTESRTEAATKVWLRLVGAGLATYDQREDRFELDHATLEVASGQ